MIYDAHLSNFPSVAAWLFIWVAFDVSFLEIPRGRGEIGL